MFKFVVLVAFFGLVAAVDDFAAETKAIENVISPAGESFHYAFQTSNGIDVNSDGDANVIKGSWKYTSPEGVPITLEYFADADGYHPSGDLPTPPPVPAYIIRAVEWNLAHPQVQESTLGRKL